MSQLKFKRKLGEVWVFELTAKDRTGARQSVLGQQLNARLLPSATDTPIWTETSGTGVTINETGASNQGDFTYERSNLTGIVAGGFYRLDFAATINGKLIEFPEDGYIIIEALA